MSVCYNISLMDADSMHTKQIVFWEQQGIQTFGQKIQITRPHASQPAFEKHFAQLIEEYTAVHAINLLGTKENEAILSHAYAQHLHAARSAVFGNDIGITNFDFHAVVRIGGHDSVMRELRLVHILSKPCFFIISYLKYYQ